MVGRGAGLEWNDGVKGSSVAAADDLSTMSACVTMMEVSVSAPDVALINREGRICL